MSSIRANLSDAGLSPDYSRTRSRVITGMTKSQWQMTNGDGISAMSLDSAPNAPTIIGHWSLIRRTHESVRELSGIGRVETPTRKSLWLLANRFPAGSRGMLEKASYDEECSKLNISVSSS